MRRTVRAVVPALAVAVVPALLVTGCKSSGPKTQIYSIGGGGMANTFANGDKVQVELTSSVARGDVIAFDGNKAGGKWDTAVVNPKVPNVFFKRVIAVAGDTVECPPVAPGSDDCGSVLVNGKALDESAYTYGTGSDATTATKVQYPTHTFASVTIATGQLFVLGDHRDDSVDSREDGSIATTSVVGKVIAITAPRSAPVSHSPS